MPSDSLAEPQEAISFRDWVSANALLTQSKPLAEILKLLGIDQPTWTQVNGVYMSYLEKKLAADPMFGNVYAEMFSDPTLTSSSPASKVLTRGEFMRIQGILDEGKSRGEDPAITLQTHGISTHDLAVTGRQYAMPDTTNFTHEQLEEFHRTLYQDNLDRSAIYREKFFPTYEAFQAYEKRVQDFCARYSAQHLPPDPSDTDYYDFSDTLEKALDEFHVQNGLTTTAYDQLASYWEKYKWEQEKKYFESIFSTPDDFFTFYNSLLDYRLEHSLMELTEEEAFASEEGYIALLKSRGYDYVSWIFAEYYGTDEVLNPEQKEIIVRKRQSLYNY